MHVIRSTVQFITATYLEQRLLKSEDSNHDEQILYCIQYKTDISSHLYNVAILAVGSAKTHLLQRNPRK